MEVKILENQSVVSNYYATEFSRVIRYVGAVKKKKKKKKNLPRSLQDK